MRYFISILLCLSGCATQITDLRPYVDDGRPEHQTVDAVLSYYFTDEAYAVLKDIPLEDAPVFGHAYAAGTTRLSSVWHFLTTSETGRAVVVNGEFFGNSPIRTIIHEYTHHLDDLTRNEGAEFIDIDEFEAAYRKCYTDTRYKGIVLFTERYANSWFTDNFGIGGYAEHIAYTGCVIALQDCPPYLGHAYRKIYRKYH